jgi:predicted Holliday junction resolvase-like endonuclease
MYYTIDIGVGMLSFYYILSNTLSFIFYKPILLDMVITDGWVIFLIIVIAFIIWVLSFNFRELNKKVVEQENKLREQDLTFRKKDAELKLSYQNWALSELEKFKNTELTNLKKTIENNAFEAASILLQKWKIENEAIIRQDAINRSYSVNLGKITEHLIPFHLSFPFNPKDARFIGSPIDLIVFDGCSDKNDNIIIYIVEIKTGNSKLTELQKKIKAAVLSGDIRWAEINPDNQQPLEISTNNLNKIDNNQFKFPLK